MFLSVRARCPIWQGEMSEYASNSLTVRVGLDPQLLSFSASCWAAPGCCAPSSIPIEFPTSCARSAGHPETSKNIVGAHAAPAIGRKPPIVGSHCRRIERDTHRTRPRHPRPQRPDSPACTPGPGPEPLRVPGPFRSGARAGARSSKTPTEKVSLLLGDGRAARRAVRGGSASP